MIIGQDLATFKSRIAQEKKKKDEISEQEHQWGWDLGVGGNDRFKEQLNEILKQ